MEGYISKYLSFIQSKAIMFVQSVFFYFLAIVTCWPLICCLRYDHILKWELFQLMDLDTYQGMLKLLFMKELERIVKSYEAYRQALLTELDMRKQRQQWYAQQPTKNFPHNMWTAGDWHPETHMP